MSLENAGFRELAHATLAHANKDLARLCDNVKGTGRLVIDDRSDPDIPLWVPKIPLMEAYALAHGIRRKRGRHIVLSIRDYLKEPDCITLNAHEAKARLREYERAMFPVMPFSLVKRKYGQDKLEYYMELWEQNPADMFIVTLLSYIPFYWMVNLTFYLASVDWVREGPLFYDVFMASVVVCAVLSYLSLLWYNMLQSAPFPTYFIDFGHFTKLLCFTLIFDIGFLTRSAMFVSAYVPSTRQHLVACHMSTLCFITLASYTRGALNMTTKMDRGLYTANFLFLWIDVLCTMGAGFAYAGSSPAVQWIYFVVFFASLFIWVMPMLFGAVETRSGMMKQVLVLISCVDAPMAILGLAATPPDERSTFIVFDICFKGFQVARVSRILWKILDDRFQISDKVARMMHWLYATAIAPAVSRLRKVWLRVRPAWCDRMPSCSLSVWRHRMTRDYWARRCNREAWKRRCDKDAWDLKHRQCVACGTACCKFLKSRCCQQPGRVTPDTYEIVSDGGADGKVAAGGLHGQRGTCAGEELPSLNHSSTHVTHDAAPSQTRNAAQLRIASLQGMKQLATFRNPSRQMLDLLSTVPPAREASAITESSSAEHGGYDEQKATYVPKDTPADIADDWFGA